MPKSYPSEFRDVLEETLKTYLYDTAESKSTADLLKEVRDRLGSISGTISVDNFPTDYPDSVAHDLLGSIHNRLHDVKGSVVVTNMPTDYLKEGGTVNVGNLPTDFPDSQTHSMLGSIYDRQLKVSSTPDAGTVYVGTVEAQIVPADAGRLDLALYNSGPGTVYIGPSGKTHYPIPPDGQLAMSFRGALYGSADTDNTLIRYLALKL